MFTISTTKEDIAKLAGDVLVVPFFKDELKGAFFERVDALCGGALGRAVQCGDFAAKRGQVHFSYGVHGDITRVCAVGFGSRAKMSERRVYEVLSGAFQAAQKCKARSYIVLSDAKAEAKLKSYGWGAVVCKALALSTYHFDRYITRGAAKLTMPEALVCAGVRDVVKVRDGAERELIVAEATNWVRDLGNHPAGDMTPTSLAEDVRAACRGTGVRVRVLNEDAMRELGMGAMLGVSKGSSEEATMVIMEYKGAGAGVPPVVFCGKGITFDSGGISIKPSSKMDEMKFDMLGAATVAGGVRAIAQLKLKVNVVGILACAENLPSGSALRPGDILAAMNGTTIEVVNTDAEGRLVLADALSYAKKYKPQYVVDFATLTGACVVALGTHYAGLFSPDTAIRDKVMKAAKQSGDALWELPVTEEYREHIKSKVADVKNMGRNGEAGASSAAAFLKEFVDYPWAHIDMASAWDMHGGGGLHCGATGFGVHLIVDMVG